MVSYAKQHMLVGPARGSLAAVWFVSSWVLLILILLPHGLIFERFIDVTRYDLPDIDIDFQDDKREMVFDTYRNEYGADKVARLGTISRHKARSAIGLTAKALGIPAYESAQIADIVMKRNDGDDRADYCVYDTFTDTDAGQAFITKYPNMMLAAKLEAHANHSSRHAAGVIITNDPINHYIARDAKTNAAQIDKYDAEKINLMKVDLVGFTNFNDHCRLLGNVSVGNMIRSWRIRLMTMWHLSCYAKVSSAASFSLKAKRYRT